MWPTHGLAHYELALTRRKKAEAGLLEQPQKDPNSKPDAAVIESLHSPEVMAGFAASRRFDPLNEFAYQGVGGPEMADSFVIMAGNVRSAYKKLADRSLSIDEQYQLLDELSRSLNKAGVYDLAIVIRQTMAAQRGGYSPDDLPIFEKGLRSLAPGEETEKILSLLGGREPMTLRVWCKIDPP